MDSYFHRLIICGSFSIFAIVGRDIFRAGRNCRRTTVEVKRGIVVSDRTQRAHISTTLARQCEGYSAHLEFNPQRQPPRTAADVNMKATARSYLRCSLLFFFAMMVTWVWLPLHSRHHSQTLPNSEPILLTANISSHLVSIWSTACFILMQQSIAWTY
jgi:hypothetical protein